MEKDSLISDLSEIGMVTINQYGDYTVVFPNENFRFEFWKASPSPQDPRPKEKNLCLTAKHSSKCFSCREDILDALPDRFKEIFIINISDFTKYSIVLDGPFDPWGD